MVLHQLSNELENYEDVETAMMKNKAQFTTVTKNFSAGVGTKNVGEITVGHFLS